MSSILIHNGAVLTADGWVEPGYLYVEGNSIKSIGAGEAASELTERADTVISAQHKAVLPGLTNAHTHFGQTFMRGLAGGRALLPWLKELIWPLQSAMTIADMRLAATLGLLENLRCGVTHVVDHHKITATPQHTDAVCQAAQDVGLNLTLARSWSDAGKNAEGQESIMSDLERLFARWHSGNIRIANGPLATWRCSPETLQKTHEIARQHNSLTHLHVSEARDEVQMCATDNDLSPVAWLDSLSVLDDHTHIVHAVWVDDAEIELLAKRGAVVVHCPVSNAVLGSGVAPVARMLQRGVKMRLGTDGPASNDTQDIFETMKMALSLARVTALDPTALSPAAALALATDGKVLSPGAPADIIIVNLNHSRAVPVHDITSALTLCTHGSDVETIIVGGEVLMREGRVLVLDEAALLAECAAAIKGLRRRAGLD